MNTNKDIWLNCEVIHQGHDADLVDEDDNRRVWVSRCEFASDGSPIVSFEHCVDGRWTVTEKY